MKNILCFGDSNTWGYEPLVARRYPADVRWTGVLQNSLGDGFRVIEEGLNGRTNVTNEAERPIRSGLDVLPVILFSSNIASSKFEMLLIIHFSEEDVELTSLFIICVMNFCLFVQFDYLMP